MRKITGVFTGLLSASASVLLALVLSVGYILPGRASIESGEQFIINRMLSLTKSEEGVSFAPKVIGSCGTLYDLKINLFGGPAAREVVSLSERRMVVPGGNPFGIKLRTEGVLVVGMTDIQDGLANQNPAKEAGLKVGDIITEIGGKKPGSGDDVREAIAGSEGKPLSIKAYRDGQSLELELSPVPAEFDSGYKAGIWVRDSSAGIGTMTYFDPQSRAFAGLGHAVCDVDTGKVMPLGSGEIVDVNISGVNAGQSGRPGELKGTFLGDSPIGTLHNNCECGLFGVLNSPQISHDPIPMALKQEVTSGPAEILVTISGNKPQSFSVNIEKVNYSDISPTKNMVIRITDEELLAATGGIVQGMSGSPIIQDGRLIGAITHVFVNDPTRGYGIFAENMDKHVRALETGRSAA